MRRVLSSACKGGVDNLMITNFGEQTGTQKAAKKGGKPKEPKTSPSAAGGSSDAKGAGADEAKPMSALEKAQTMSNQLSRAAGKSTETALELRETEASDTLISQMQRLGKALEKVYEELNSKIKTKSKTAEFYEPSLVKGGKLLALFKDKHDYAKALLAVKKRKDKADPKAAAKKKAKTAS